MSQKQELPLNKFDRLSFERRTFLKAAALGTLGAALPSSLWASGAPQPPGGFSRGPFTAFEGTLLTAARDRLELQVGNDLRTVFLQPATSFWRGGEAGAGDLRTGDAILVRVDDAQSVQRAWANLTRVSGRIVRSTRNGYVIASRGKNDQTTELELGVSDTAAYELSPSGRRVPAPGQLRADTGVDAIGMRRPDGSVLATLVNYQPADAKSSQAPIPPVTIVKREVAVAGACLCIAQYQGYAGWFDCCNGCGRCGTCSTGRSDQIAWPAFDTCGCCQWNCCDCSSGCRNQVYKPCDEPVTVVDVCGNRSWTFRVVDCGPCQKHSGCTACQQDLCNRTCADCAGRTGAVVDFTKPSFAAWYDPATRGCFSVTAEVCIPC